DRGSIQCIGCGKRLLDGSGREFGNFRSATEICSVTDTVRWEIDYREVFLSRIAVLSFSDGRDFVNRDVAAFIAEAEPRVVAALAARGHEVVAAGPPITSAAGAVAAAREAAAARPDLTVFHYAVWSFPHFSVAAARETTSPLTLVSNLDPAFPG